MTDGGAGVVNPQLCREIVQVGEQIAELVGRTAMRDPMVPTTTWTVTATAAHLAAANAHFTEIAAGGQPARHGDGTAGSLAAANARLLTSFTVRDAEFLAVQIREQAAAFVECVRQRPVDDVVDTPLGELTIGQFAGYLLTHMLGHGEGIARARRRPSMLTATQVGLVVPFVAAVMPRLVDTKVVGQLDATYELQLRDTADLGVRFDKGVPTVTELAQPGADCVVSVEPRSFFLMSAGLQPVWSLLLSGKLRAFGRKPWLAGRFARAFTFP